MKEQEEEEEDEKIHTIFSTVRPIACRNSSEKIWHARMKHIYEIWGFRGHDDSVIFLSFGIVISWVGTNIFGGTHCLHAQGRLYPDHGSDIFLQKYWYPYTTWYHNSEGHNINGIYKLTRYQFALPVMYDWLPSRCWTVEACNPHQR